jgi:DNA-binding winged helix-turn-helix (wHTH) protein
MDTIAKLRKYLKDDPSIYITNVHGTGFKLEMKKDILLPSSNP